MKNSKRLAAFLLVAALMAGLFAGCGSTEGEQATDAPGQEARGLHLVPQIRLRSPPT